LNDLDTKTVFSLSPGPVPLGEMLLVVRAFEKIEIHRTIWQIIINKSNNITKG